MPLFSFIMPVKNEEKYIYDAIQSLRSQAFCDWELIVVDDHSNDKTQEIVSYLKKSDSRIRLVQSTGSGQVQALTCGYAQTSGRFIKFIDGDDILPQSFSDHIRELVSHSASYHDLEIVDENLKRINVLHLTSKYEHIPFSMLLKKMAPIPRGSWTLSREIADRLFPIPDRTPYADVWIGLTIKKISDICYIDKPLYLYRQHNKQVYRGIYNFQGDVVVRRACNTLRLIEFLEHEGGHLWKDLPDGQFIIRSVRLYYSILSQEKIGWKKILFAPLPLIKRIRLLVVKKYPKLASCLSRTKSGARFRFLR
jgi:glycosyltransferase involved in cell wall biosynthesis